MSRITSGNSGPAGDDGLSDRTGADGRPAQVGIKDVARLAKVSQGTVSNVLNHPERVGPARRAAVERAIADLGFVRHEAARHLRSGYSRTLGLLLLDAWNPGFLEVARGVEDTTADRAWSVLIANSARDLDRERSYLRLFAEYRVAGLIVVPHDEYAESLHAIRAGGAPVVVVDRAESGTQRLSVSLDDVRGGWLVARHLIALGHRHIAFVGDETSATPVHDRLAGVRQAVAEAPEPVRLEVLPADLSTAAGRARGEELARTPPHRRPTAIAAAIDLQAFGVLQALLSHGIRVPEDISLAGYDDIPFAQQLSVPLTTVSRQHYDMGAAAAELLTATIIEGRPAVPHLVFQPELVVRASTGPATDEGHRDGQ